MRAAMNDTSSESNPTTGAIPDTPADSPTEASDFQRRQGRFFYGWRVVAVACLHGMFGNGAISTGFPIFFEPIRGDLGISYASMSLVF